MCSRIGGSPGVEKLSFFIVNDYVVLRFVGEQQDAAFPVLDHFMAVLYGMLRRIEFTPFGIEPVLFVALAKNNLIVITERKMRGKPQCRSSCGSPADKMFPVHTLHILK